MRQESRFLVDVSVQWKPCPAPRLCELQKQHLGISCNWRLLPRPWQRLSSAARLAQRELLPIHTVIYVMTRLILDAAKVTVSPNNLLFNSKFDICLELQASVRAVLQLPKQPSMHWRDSKPWGLV